MAGQFLDEQVIQQYHLPSRKQSEAVIYYRKPNKGLEANWIVCGDSQIHKQALYLMRGWHALAQYGLVGRASCLFESAYKWYPILAHPDGPAEFPVEQILQFGWHRPGGLPPFPPGKNVEVFWPQLAGQELIDFDCPQCENRPFIKAVHLANHLMTSHGWDYHTIMQLGEKLDIDFAKDFAPKSKRTYSMPTEAPSRESAVVVGPKIVKAVIPTFEELTATATEQVAVAPISIKTRKPLSTRAKNVNPNLTPTGRPKRTLSPERREASLENLAKARAVRESAKAQALISQMLEPDE